MEEFPDGGKNTPMKMFFDPKKLEENAI